MKIVVIGGTGLLDSKLVDLLRKRGNQVIAAAPDTGVNTLTDEGLAEVLAGADVVVGVAKVPRRLKTMQRWSSSGRQKAVS